MDSFLCMIYELFLETILFLQSLCCRGIEYSVRYLPFIREYEIEQRSLDELQIWR